MKKNKVIQMFRNSIAIEKEIGINFKYKDKLEYVAEEEVSRGMESVNGKLLRGELKGMEIPGFLLNQLNRILAEGRPWRLDIKSKRISLN